MEIRLYYQMLRRGWWIILLTTLVAVVAALGASYLATPQYQAIARFIITPSAALPDRPDIVLQSLGLLDNQTVMITYTEVMDSNRIYNDTLSTLQLQPEDIKDYKYTSVVEPNSAVLLLTVTGPNPQMAAKLANTIGDQTINFTRRLNQVYNVDFLDTAIPPILPSSPQPVVNTSLALTLGLLFGVVFAILSEQLRIPLEIFGQRLKLDPETGVLNSKYFSQYLEEELDKKPNEVMTIGIIELNALRDLLDTFPIAGLQKIMQKVTESLRKELRGNDIIGRWNEISLIVMLPNTTGVAAKRIFERIFQALSQPVDLDQFGKIVNLDSTIGGAEYTSNITAEELLDKASRALEQSRRDNDNHVYIMNVKSPFWIEKKASS